MSEEDRGPQADPRKVKVLVDLLQERPYTYEELAQHPLVGLKRRRLQEYLERFVPNQGHTVKRSREGGGVTRFWLEDDDDTRPGGASQRASLALARGVLNGLFPLEGTVLDKPVSARVLAFASGVPRFEERHRRVLLRWIAACESAPPYAVWLCYQGPNARDPTSAERRLVWPLGVILREGRRVYLQGLVDPYDSLECSRNFALERVAANSENNGLRRAEPIHQTLPDFLRTRRPHPSTLVDAPFSLVRPQKHEAVMVHLRVEPDQVPFLRGRLWHPSQQELLRDDGSMELHFGPVDRSEAIGWCGQWWKGVTVLGDTLLRAAYQDSLSARLRAQDAAPTPSPPGPGSKRRKASKPL